ncbi:MAG TPA: ankyrin repeat domain-containing protein, partial [Blastocatellia bacterium]|nr:ankyrin repeat domain-containing protein [Blastocatellia bacterium]
ALLDAGAAINGNDEWSPIEEALYWGHRQLADLLVNRGASVHNLRIAAGLGKIEMLDSFFDRGGALKPEAGVISWPFGKLRESERSGSREHLLNNSLVYACTNNQIEAAEFLLKKGADVNSIPPGFDYNGTPLHNAALNGHKEIVDLLLAHGADPAIKDNKISQTAARWAANGGHSELAAYLKRRAAEHRPGPAKMETGEDARS